LTLLIELLRKKTIGKNVTFLNCPNSHFDLFKKSWMLHIRTNEESKTSGSGLKNKLSRDGTGLLSFWFPGEDDGPHFLHQDIAEQFPFLGIDHVRRILEPDQLLDRRLECGEIPGGYLRGDFVVVSALHEKDRDLQLRHAPEQVDFEQLRPEKLHRTQHSPEDVDAIRQAVLAREQHVAQNDADCSEPAAVDLAAEARHITSFADRLGPPVAPVRRRPHFFQGPDGAPGIPLPGLVQRPPIGSELALFHVGDLADADIAVIEFRVPGDGQGADGAAPRVPGQNDPLLGEFPHQVQGQFPRIADELVDVHFAAVGDGGIRLAGAALVPVHDGEKLLEAFRVAPVRRQLRRPGPAVQEQDDRVVGVLGPLEDPLAAPADVHLLEHGDALGRIGFSFQADPRRVGRKEEAHNDNEDDRNSD